MYSRKLLSFVPCVEECLLASLSDRLLASRLSPSSLVGGTLRGLAPEGRIYQSEQFYISANTTEEDCTDLTSYGMGIKIPCKSHWRSTGLYAGYRMTLFQKVFIRYPFILPSYCAPFVTIAPQKYNDYLKRAISVNFILTFRVNICNSGFRRIAAMFKSLIYNYIRINDICKNANTIVVLNVVGSSPTVHPTRKSYDYQLVMGFRVSIIIPIPP